MYIYSLCPTFYKYALSLVRPWAYKFRAIFPAFYSKNCLQKLENKPAICRPLSRSHQSKNRQKNARVRRDRVALEITSDITRLRANT